MIRYIIAAGLLGLAVFWGLLGLLTKNVPSLVIAGAMTIGVFIMIWPSKNDS